MIQSDLSKKILWEPLQKDVNRLCIISAYATPNMASWVIKNISGRTSKAIDISLIVGMVAYDGISIAVHEGFVELQRASMPKEISKFSCSYICELPAIHTNLFIWLEDDKPLIAFTGSAHFTQPSFSKNRREVMIECNPDEAYEYYCKVIGDSIYCNHGEIEDNVTLYPTHPILDKENNPVECLSGSDIGSVTLSLLSRSGETGGKSGLNWGQRNKRNRNEAYISLPVAIARTGFFPLNKQHFTVVTDDHHQLIFRVEQENDKAITTPLSNALLGEYFRNRLGLANGEYVTKQHLLDYGRTDVTFYKLDEEQFYMDFSVS